MLAPPVGKAQTKTAQSSTSKQMSARSMLIARPSAGGAGEHAHMLQTSIGNQAMLRLLEERAPWLTGNEPHGYFQTKLAMSRVDDPSEQEVDRVAEQIARTPEHSTHLGKPVESAHGGGPVLARQPQNDAPPSNGTTATAEREREVEAINVGGTNYVLYQTKVRGGGSSAWLANNPGNLDYTADTVAWGCYEGKALIWGKHRFAIFQDENAGLAAVRGFLRKYQTTRDITLMMNLFAPATDLKNNPTQYSEKVAKHIGPPVTVHTLVKDLTDDQIQLFAEAIKDAEGWTPGPVNDVPRGDPSLPEEVRNR